MDKKTAILIKGYLEKAEEKLHFAEILLRDGGYDDAVSRAYYCAFHATQAILLTEGLSVRSHSGLVNLFGMHFVRTGKIEQEYGRFLSELKDKRENGDYEIYSAIEHEAAKEAVENAQRFLERIRTYLKKELGSVSNKKRNRKHNSS